MPTVMNLVELERADAECPIHVLRVVNACESAARGAGRRAGPTATDYRGHIADLQDLRDRVELLLSPFLHWFLQQPWGAHAPKPGAPLRPVAPVAG